MLPVVSRQYSHNKKFPNLEIRYQLDQHNLKEITDCGMNSSLYSVKEVLVETFYLSGIYEIPIHQEDYP